MNTSTIFTLIMVLIVAIVGFALLSQTSTNNTDNDTQTEQTDQLSVRSATTNDQGAFITLSDGTERQVASAVPFEEDNFEEVQNYREAFVSPDNTFVAFSGSGFEESFVQVYSAESDRLYDKIFGVFDRWEANGRLVIESCNLAGEQCTTKASVSGDRPWEVRETTEQDSDDGLDNGTIRSSFNARTDFVSAISQTDQLSVLSQTIKSSERFVAGTGPFTMFAPDDQAFASLSRAEINRLVPANDLQARQDFLQNHIVAGSYSYEQLLDLTSLETVNGTALTLEERSGSIIINDNIIITAADLETSNGVVHVIDKIIR